MTKESLVEALSPLLVQLKEVKAKISTTVCRSNTDESSSPAITDDLFKKIEGSLGFIKDIFLRLERWESDVQDELGEIAKKLDDISEQDGGEEFCRLKLEAVDQKLTNLKKSHITPPLQLPTTVTESITPPTSVAESSSPSNALEEDPTPLDSGVLSVRLVLARQQEGVTSTIGLSYKYFCCLLFLAIFPANVAIKKRWLFNLWIGRGIVEAEEEVGRIWNTFIRWKLITPINKVGGLSPDNFWLLQGSRLFADSFSVPPKVQDELNRLLPYPFSYYNVQVRLLEPAVAAEEIVESTADNLVRSCINVNRRHLKFERSDFLRMKKFYVLHLGWLQINTGSAKYHHIEVDNTEFLEWLGSYFQDLRYLGLQGISRIVELPPSIGNLTNLTILDLQACYNLEKLPVEITMLSNLTRLDVSKCYFINHMPKGIGSLSQLQVLKGFVMGSSKSKDPCRLKELSRLKKLIKLSISIRHDSLVEEGELGELISLETLRALTISWAGGISHSGRQEQASTTRIRMMTNVSPPPNLEKLDLRCFPGSTAPEWLSSKSLKMLQKLYIRGGILLRTLGEDSLPSVEVLRLKFLKALDVKRSYLSYLFPSMRYLEIHECNNLESTPLCFLPEEVERVKAEHKLFKEDSFEFV